MEIPRTYNAALDFVDRLVEEGHADKLTSWRTCTRPAE